MKRDRTTLKFIREHFFIQERFHTRNATEDFACSHFLEKTVVVPPMCILSN